MNRFWKWLFPMLALSLFAALTVPGLAAETKGKIKSVSAVKKQVVLTDQNGKDWTIDVDPLVRITVNGKAGKLEDLKTGASVLIDYDKKGEKLIAKKIEGK